MTPSRLVLLLPLLLAACATQPKPLQGQFQAHLIEHAPKDEG